VIEAGERTALHEYKSPVADNSRWEGFVHRPGDIFVCTPPKAGTTWMQTIVASLMWPDGDAPGVVGHISPWVDARFEPVDVILERLEAQPHRRFIKTHTPPDGIPWFPTGSYIAVGRDGRDALMSFDNHLAHMRSDILRDDEGAPAMPPYSGDVHELFEFWLTTGDYLATIAQWWERRDEPNVVLVHYNDMKADLEGQMRRVAAFLELEVPENKWPAVVERCTFDSMRDRSSEIADFDRIFEGGAESFLYKGTNERWRGVLTDDELARYEMRVAELLPPDAVDWLEHGSVRPH
jgi:aryl sulfotransferase